MKKKHMLYDEKIEELDLKTLNEQKTCRQRRVNSITIKKKKSFEGDLTVIAASGDPLGCTAK